MRKQYIRALKAVTFTICIYFLPGAVSHAQQTWNLQLEPMYMGVAGTDNHLANITTTTSTLIDPTSQPPITISTSTTASNSTSQNFDMSGNGTFRGQLEFMPEDWGVGVSGWWFDTSDSISLSLNSSPLNPVATTVNYSSNNFSLSAPHSSSRNGLIILANSSLGVWNIDAYGIKTLGEFDNGRVNMTLGAKFGSIDIETSETVNRYQPSVLSGPIFGISSPSFTQNGSATNSANASFLAGPSIGVQGLGKYGKHRVEGFLSQSVLIGNVDYKTIASSQYSFSYSSPYGSYSYSINDSMNLSDSETLAIPVTEVKIKYLYDVTENLSLGLGFFGSAWIDTPTVPAVQSSDRHYKTLFFYGGLASINLRY